MGAIVHKMEQQNEQSITPQVPMVNTNPFEMEQYRNVPMPDVPLSTPQGMVESLLDNSEVPAPLREKYWFVFNKDNVLTFLDEKRKFNKLLGFDIAKIDALNSMPYYDYDFEMEMEMGLMRNMFETKLDRAMGIKGGNVKNERIILQSQFTENRQISEMDQGSNVQKGFFKRLLSRR